MALSSVARYQRDAQMVRLACHERSAIHPDRRRASLLGTAGRRSQGGPQCHKRENQNPHAPNGSTRYPGGAH